MTKIDIFSGFLGSGKTTLIRKLIQDSYKGEKLVLIENEFGEIGIDGGFLKDSGIQINEMSQGCICCSLKGDFKKALTQVMNDYTPDRIIIEPTGVGKLSDVVRAVKDLDLDTITLNAFCTVVDAGKCKMYMKNYGEFFNDQVKHAGTIIMSHSDTVKGEKLQQAVELVKGVNPDAVIVTTPIAELDGKTLLEAIERKDTLKAAIELLEHEDEHEHHHHHHHHDEDGHCDCGCEDDDDDDDDDDDECECGHHHHHDDDDEEHEHHHHHHDDDDDDDDDDEHEHHHHHHDDDDDDDDDDEHEHHHHFDENGHCSCGCEDHDHEHHHHHHHADEVFVSWGRETTKKFTKEGLQQILDIICDENEYGMVLRSKGIVQAEDGTWIHFDYTPGESDIRTGSAGIIGRLCVIGSKLNEENLEKLFGI